MRKHLMRRGIVSITGPDGETYRMMTVAHALADYQRRRVAETFIGHGRKRIRISTVRLTGAEEFGMDSEEWQRLGIQPYETLVIGGPLDDDRWNWADRTMARIGHSSVAEVVRMVEEAGRQNRARLRRLHKSYRAAWA